MAPTTRSPNRRRLLDNPLWVGRPQVQQIASGTARWLQVRDDLWQSQALGSVWTLSLPLRQRQLALTGLGCTKIMVYKCTQIVQS